MDDARPWIDTLERSSPRGATVAPWTSEQLVGLLAANVVGAGLVCVGWWQTIARDPASEQLGWLNLALAGVVIAGAANALWLARGRRMVTLAKSSVMPHSWITAVPSEGDGGLWALTSLGRTRAVAGNGHRPGTAVAGSLVATETMSRFHAPDCLLAAGKAVTAANRAAHLAAGRVPCEVCEP